MTTILEVFGLEKVTPWAGKEVPNPQYVVNSDELIGIEVEVENVEGAFREGSVPRYWRIDTDGSLRNGGIEAISRQPILASFGPTAVESLLKNVLPEQHCFSPRTSIHVHLNMQDTSMEKVKDFVIVYSLFERALYEFVGRGRDRNIYCLPLCETSLLSGFAINGVRDIIGAWSKYTGLNLCTLQNYGTVEFRHMHGTNNLDKLTVWINLITRIKAYVLATSTSNIRKEFSTLTPESDFQQITNAVFGEFGNYLQGKWLQRLPETYVETKTCFMNPFGYASVDKNKVNLRESPLALALATQ